MTWWPTTPRTAGPPEAARAPGPPGRAYVQPPRDPRPPRQPRQQPQRRGQRPAYRPLLGETEHPLPAPGVADPDHGFRHGEASLLDPGHLHRAGFVEGHHDAVGITSLRYRAQHVAGVQDRSLAHHGRERPLLRLVQRRDGQSPRQKEAVAPGQRFQGVLEPVVDLTQQPGTEGDREHPPGLLDGIANVNRLADIAISRRRGRGRAIRGAIGETAASVLSQAAGDAGRRAT